MQKKRIRRIILAFSFCMTILLMGCGLGESLAFEDMEGSDVSPGQIEQAEPVMKKQDGEVSEQEPERERENTNGADLCAQEKSDASPIFVHVSGAVRSPGVYELKNNARVFEAIQAAGGMTDDAAENSINQAATLADGQMIRILTMEEWAKAGEKEENIPNQADTLFHGMQDDGADGKVNINTADEAMLMSLPGIGKVRAKQIITYREEHGSFQSIDEVKKIDGIKDGLFEQIRDLIIV